MKTYLVGGAIRDSISGLPIKERDWVCTGTTENALSSNYFKSVGKDFPVFLNPETHEEYALARIEKKTGMGYKNFTFLTGSVITLLEDIKRRDLTINSIARSENGVLIDPYSGAVDFKKKILRHTTRCFSEDPVRILRIARLHSKYPKFNVNEKTIQLMLSMVVAGEIDYLSPDRVWKEFTKAILEERPVKFFQTAYICKALPIIFPNIVFNKDVENKFIKTADLVNAEQIRFAALMINNNVQTFLHYKDHYNIPKKFSSLTETLYQCIALYYKINCRNVNSDVLMRLIRLADAARRPDRFSYFLIAATCCVKNKDKKQNIEIIKSVLNYAKSLRSIRKKGKSLKSSDHLFQVHCLRNILRKLHKSKSR